MNSVGTAGSSWSGKRRKIHAPARQYGDLVDGSRPVRVWLPGPTPVLAAGLVHSSTVESGRKWLRLYPDKTEFTQICSGKYPTYVVGNYKSKEICFFITMAYNSNFPKNRFNTGFSRDTADPTIHHMNITPQKWDDYFIFALWQRIAGQ
ncbi:hypothetical protein [Herbaspirillum rubrisubalbicans]|uniref:hypothetical protein n=1 Tax=Herbaspirillum rubrisubalbicans TaxID=80842 RepID=UPI0012E34511|nr:hypothetical protein [Herbaspirillum rubrisubalbicans]